MGVYVAIAWAAVATVILGLWCYSIGASDGDAGDEVPVAVLIALAWPVVVALVVIGAPFAGLYYLGEWRREARRGGAR